MNRRIYYRWMSSFGRGGVSNSILLMSVAGICISALVLLMIWIKEPVPHVVRIAISLLGTIRNMHGEKLMLMSVSCVWFLALAATALAGRALHSERVRRYALYLTFSLGLSWSLYLLCTSHGVIMHDEAGHFMISRYAWSDPRLILNFWGRPLNTLCYMPAAPFGLFGAGVLALIYSSLTVLVAVKVARHLGVVYLHLVPVFIWIQPLFYIPSIHSLPEIPFMLFLYLGICAALEKREFAASMLFGAIPLIRHEGVCIAALWFGYMLFRRQWKAALISTLPTVLYNVVFALTFHKFPYISSVIVKQASGYTSASWAPYLKNLAVFGGFPVIFFSLLAVSALIKKRSVAVVTVLGPLAYLALHMFILRFGMFGTGGAWFYLVVLAPLLGILASWGAERAIAYVGTYSYAPIRCLTLAAVCVALCITPIFRIDSVYGAYDMASHFDSEEKLIFEVGAWIKSMGITKDRIVATHVWLYYIFDIPIQSNKMWSKAPRLSEKESGTIAIWDSHYSKRSKLYYSELADPKNGWKELRKFKGRIIEVVVFQKT